MTHNKGIVADFFHPICWTIEWSLFRLLRNEALIPLEGGKFSHGFQVRLGRQTIQPRSLQDWICSWLGNSRYNILTPFNPMSSGSRASLWGNPRSQDLHLVQCGFHFVLTVCTRSQRNITQPVVFPHDRLDKYRFHSSNSLDQRHKNYCFWRYYKYEAKTKKRKMSEHIVFYLQYLFTLGKIFFFYFETWTDVLLIIQPLSHKFIFAVNTHIKKHKSSDTVYAIESRSLIDHSQLQQEGRWSCSFTLDCNQQINRINGVSIKNNRQTSNI